MRVLVTGADGFVGRHLVARLGRAGHDVIKVCGPRDVADHRRLEITEAEEVSKLVAQTEPQAVVHLAGFSSVAASFRDPVQAFRVNALGTVHLLEALKKHASTARLLFVSSGEVYGRTEADKLAQEGDAPAPLNPYASAKVAAEAVVLQYARTGTHALVARPFNHLGAGQHRDFVLPTFARQLRQIAAGAQAPRIQVGNLTPVRDFSHVDDVVDAYVLLLERGEPGSITNVASGVGRTIESLLHELIAVSGLEVSVEVDPSRFRAVDAPRLVGSAERLGAMGWKPKRTVAEAIAAVYADVSA